MGDGELRTSDIGLRVRVATTGVAVLGICLFMTVVFRGVLGLGTNFERYVLLALWILLPAMWLLGSIMAQNKWRKTTYKLTNDALVITQGSTFGGKSRQLYRYDSIIAVDVEQDAWGSRNGYGDIYLDIPRLGRRVVLRGVMEPEKQTKALKARIAHRGQAQPLNAI